jgi:hypothetical protein
LKFVIPLLEFLTFPVPVMIAIFALLILVMKLRSHASLLLLIVMMTALAPLMPVTKSQELVPTLKSFVMIMMRAVPMLVILLKVV